MFNQTNQFSFEFGKNSVLVKLLYANIAVFLGTKLLYLVLWLLAYSSTAEQFALNWFAVPAKLDVLLFKPWTLFTYMFLHIDFWHILSNMLWLYFLGQLFVEFLGERKLWTVYIAGGLAGAVLYILFFNLFPVFEDVMPVSKALGASASVMAIIVAVGTYIPNFSIRLLFLGNVKLKYIALFWFVFDLLSISNSNSGGHIAHLGGAALGFFFARQWKSGTDITLWVEKSWNTLTAIFKNSSGNRSKMKVKYSKSRQNQFDSNQQGQQKRVDEILDKISKSGYDSLTKAEKDILFKASNKS